MKYIMILFSVFMLSILTACNDVSTDATPSIEATPIESCNPRGCINISIEHPVKALKPAKIRIGILTTEMIEEFSIVLGGQGIESTNIEPPPEAIEIVPFKYYELSWNIIHPEANKEYIFEGTIVLTKPSDKTGVHRYVIFIIGHNKGWVSVGGEIKIFLDDNGNEMDPEIVKTLQYRPPELVHEVTGIIDFPTETPHPTFPPPTPTETDTPTPTETPINYPAPEHTEVPINYPAPVSTPSP